MSATGVPAFVCAPDGTSRGADEVGSGFRVLIHVGVLISDFREGIRRCFRLSRLVVRREVSVVLARMLGCWVGARVRRLVIYEIEIELKCADAVLCCCLAQEMAF